MSVFIFILIAAAIKSVLVAAKLYCFPQSTYFVLSGHEWTTETHFLAKIFSDHLLDLLHGALRSFAVQHLQRCGVLFRQQVIQSTEVLANLDEGSPVGTAQIPQTLRRSQVHLEEDPHSFSPSEENWVKKYFFLMLI